MTDDSAGFKGLKGLKVLVIDDSKTIRRTAETLLGKEGCEVFTAIDGFDALSKLAEHQPDIVFVDVEMPRTDGYELAAQVRSDPRTRDVPIVMITSRTGEKHRTRALELGVDEYLDKPYQESQLLDAVARLIARRFAQLGLPAPRYSAG